MDSRPSQQSVKPSHGATASYIRQPRQRMTQNYLLLWLDTSIDQTNENYKNTLKKIRTITNDVNAFTQLDACIDFLTDAQEDIKSFLVAKDTVSRQIMPLINDIPQLDRVYIFNDIKTPHEEWTEKWQKIKSVHTNVDNICQELQLDIKQYHQNSIAMSFLTVNGMASTNNLNQLEPTFMYTQIFKDILLDMEHGTQGIKTFTAYCRNNNSVSPTNIDRFEKEYHAHLAIWWYTFPSNIYSMLNYGLRTLDADIIITMGFFLRDVHKQIQQLYEQQISTYGKETFLVYRGQGFVKSDFEKLQRTQGGLISFNNFLSTSKDKGVSIGYAHVASTEPDKVGILFIMSIDPCIKSTPFASIKVESYFKEEDEILFSMHTIFRVNTIKQMDNTNQLYQVELQLTSDDDQQLRLLTDRIREEAGGNTGWKRLGNLLIKIGEFNKAEEFYDVLIKQTSDDGEKAVYCNQLGYVKDEQGDYEKAIWYYAQALEIQEKTLPSNYLDWATSYNNIGLVCYKMGENWKALSFYEKALEILQKSLLPNHPDLATLYENIGGVYDSLGEYSEALSFYKKALEIREKTLPSNHPDLAASYSNIGSVYDNMGEYWKVLSFYEKALEIYQKTLPSNHPHLASSYLNIAKVYDKMGEYPKALSSHEKALEIREKTLPTNHPDLATSYNNIGNVYDNMGENLKAMLYYEKAFQIYQITLPSNHPYLAISYNNIGLVYGKTGEYSKALSSHEKALEIREKSLPTNHTDLATSYNNIGNVYDNMGENLKAFSYYEKAFEIYQITLPSNHPLLATSYNNMGAAYGKMGEYSKALSSYEKALEIREKSLPSNHPDLATSYNNIGLVYNHMGEYSKALPFFEKAFEICQITLPSNHSDLAIPCNNIGSVYRNTKDYLKALLYFEHALSILQRALPPTHPHIKKVKNNIESVKKEIVENS
ncbi:unnamed protein product [Adineta steineri]|uniref:NAD(P)(+)--arginine ADP-ribosyltransferase n=1 Tax=Adineta steineri TaxID=433720 RepID=A0A814XAQ6_9BILA|nr:unnamed protein product [Adineta steineri]CAF1212380.1 unnamed protein product [Adineta steineri]CAF3666148.1 unnamed protein product [Adineta steineri]CAF3725435.1 unnamed protein product [Adineta steineri]